jgi:hypothetical protein
MVKEIIEKIKPYSIEKHYEKNGKNDNVDVKRANILSRLIKYSCILQVKDY